MREEIKEAGLEAVNGGRYYLNSNNRKIAFSTLKGTVLTLNSNCNDYEAMALLDSLIGQYPNQEEYDKACVAALKAKGWV